MIRRPPRSTHCISSAASDVYKRQVSTQSTWDTPPQLDVVVKLALFLPEEKVATGRTTPDGAAFSMTGTVAFLRSRANSGGATVAQDDKASAAMANRSAERRFIDAP
eukprot:TRINITY_DN1028_c0_g1_i1.p4 TRINITY_DN1028_c0_g1~~TRINITY_DN1028_c0_g1_i1.p4  ORF type:complete len:107 (-),score=23.55 TRINITY_DN1028_c0_g1_i1:573-893(-)